MLTESVTIPLEGEQGLVFQGIDNRQQEAINAAAAPFIAERNAMVTSILAGKGLLTAVRETPGYKLIVTADGITVTPPEAA